MISSCCSNGSIVTVTDTPNNIVLVVDGVPTLIPKYKDCAGADLIAGSEVASCDDIVPLATTVNPNPGSDTHAATPALVAQMIAAFTSTPAFVQAIAAELISADAGNSLRLGTDGLLFENDAL
jgi:hypothetical protein